MVLQKITNVSSAHGGGASAKINPKTTGFKENISTGTRVTKGGREMLVCLSCFHSFGISYAILLGSFR